MDYKFFNESTSAEAAGEIRSEDETADRNDPNRLNRKVLLD